MTRLGDRLLGGIERVGNKLPEPFILFAWLILLLAVVSTAMAAAGLAVRVPGAEESTEIKGAFSSEGIAFLFSGLGPNFVNFPPLQTVVVIMLGVGLAERTGLLTTLIRASFGRAPRWLLPYVVGFVGIVFSVMSDSVFIIVPPLAALVFAAAGRHPVAGLIGGFAAAGAGYSTSILVTSLDALFAGITNAVAGTLPDPGTTVTPISNYFFNVVASILLGLLAGLLIDRVIEPRLVRAGVPRTEAAAEPDRGARAAVATSEEHSDPAATTRAGTTAVERRGLTRAGITFGGYAVAMTAFALWPNSPLRNEDGGFLPESPLLSSVVFLIFTGFLLPALAYGRTVGAIRRSADVPRLMGQAVRDLSGFIVLAFVLGQFIALFDWTGIGTWIAVTGAELLQNAGLDGFPAILGFMALASVLNLFIISGSSLWTLMGAVFVPMFALIGFEPGFAQAAFRVGDAATQVMTPLNPYMIVLLTMVRRYEPKAGLGTVIARMVPFVVPFWLLWASILGVFYFADLPLGPGMPIHLD